MNTQSTQRFVSDTASTRDSARRGSTYRNSTQLNLTICFLPRYLTRRSAAPLDSAQLNDLFFTTRRSALLRHSPRRVSTRRNSTICFLQRTFPASRRPTSRRPASQLDDLFITTQRGLWHCCAPRRYSTQRFVFYDASPCIAPQHITLLCADPQRNDLFLTAHRNSALRSATRLNVIAN